MRGHDRPEREGARGRRYGGGHAWAIAGIVLDIGIGPPAAGAGGRFSCRKGAEVE